MKYAVLWDYGDARLWWSTLEEAVEMNAQRFLDSMQPHGIIRLCESAEDARRYVRAYAPMLAFREASA